jgi:hypothetical protein
MVTEARITSTLGGNCRVRLPQNDLALQGGTLKEATGTNPNPFFETPVIKDPIISPKATMTNLKAPTTYVYDFDTKAGETYVLTNQAAGITSATSESPVVRTERHTIGGRPSSKAGKGLNIISTVHQDGSRHTEKVIR